MNVALQRASSLFPWVLAGLFIAAPAGAQTAPRGSAAWCAQMMDKPAGSWSLNDHSAFDDHCKKQHAEMARHTEAHITEDDDEVERNMEGKGHQTTTAKRKDVSPPKPPQADNGPNTASPDQTTPADTNGEAVRAARRYLEKHKDDGNTGSSH